MKIQRIQRTGDGFKERLIIKAFKMSESGHKFLSGPSNYSNSWSEYTGELPAGIYAMAGGAWHNVKKLDPSLLAHI